MSTVQWVSPSPLWAELATRTDKGAFRRPTLLRFATDEFMEELQGVLAGGPAVPPMRDYVARPESWQKPTSGLDADPDPGLRLKLYQPVHSRFYVLSAALACRTGGLPDHTIQTSKGESVGFVLRRVEPVEAPADVHDATRRREWAWITGDRPGWSAVTESGIMSGEELLPLFPMQYDAQSVKRRMFAGLVPVARRQTYAGGREVPPAPGRSLGTRRIATSASMVGGRGSAGAAATGAGSASTPSTPPPSSIIADDPRLLELQRKVIDPWAEMVDWWDNRNPPDQRSGPSVESVERGTALVLLDFATYLQNVLPSVWSAVSTRVRPGAGAVRDLYDALHDAHFRRFNMATARVSLRDALRDARAQASTLEEATITSGLPPQLIGLRLTDDGGQELQILMSRDRGPNEPRRIERLVAAALPPLAPQPGGGSGNGAGGGSGSGSGSGGGTARPKPRGSGPRVPAKSPANPASGVWFVARCVYLRPQCGPCCSAVLSEPTEPFQLASFFDADAPARSINIALPLDTTPAALRKYDKNVAFAISDELAKQMNRVKGLKKLMDGEVGSPSGIGMICSFSIPIITICALIVLMIFLQLLNIIFWWMPFFKICFPVPLLTAKEG